MNPSQDDVQTLGFDDDEEGVRTHETLVLEICQEIDSDLYPNGPDEPIHLRGIVGANIIPVIYVRKKLLYQTFCIYY